MSLKAFFKNFVTNTNAGVSLLCLSWLFITFPGQNEFQTLILNPQEPPVRAAPFELPSQITYPEPAGSVTPRALSAKSAIVLDVNSGAILFAKNPDETLPPASTTKIMTALVALDEYALADQITITNESLAEGTTADLMAGETLTVESLLSMLLVPSGNDAALALAQYHPGGYAEFVNRMNQKAQSLHMTKTHYRNASGLDQEGHVMSVHDLGLLTKEALHNPIFADIVRLPQTRVTDVSGQIVHELETTNQLLGLVPGMIGVKTGRTLSAGECLVTATQREGQTIITVVLDSADRFGETQGLIEWAFANHEWKTVTVMNDEQ